MQAINIERRFEERLEVICRAVLGGAKELYGVSIASLYSALVEYAKGEGHEASKRANK